MARCSECKSPFSDQDPAEYCETCGDFLCEKCSEPAKRREHDRQHIRDEWAAAHPHLAAGVSKGDFYRERT